MAKPWISSRVYTKISREDMALAACSDPRRKRTSPTRLCLATEKMEEIITKMRRLVKSAVDRAYVTYAHASDQAMSREDLESEVNTGLVYGIQRYDPQGKLEPYNYLNGVIHIVLINAHIRRNRMKRIPRGLLVALQAPRVSIDGPSDNETGSLEDTLISRAPSESNTIMDRIEVETLFSALEGKSSTVRSKRIPLLDIVKLLMDGGNIRSIAQKYRISGNSLRRVIRREILPILEE